MNSAPEASFLLTEVRAFAMGRTLPPTIATGPIEAVIEEELLQDFNVKYVGALRCSRAIIPGSAAKELMVCRLTAGEDWIRTSSTRAREVGCRAPTAAKIERLDDAPRSAFTNGIGKGSAKSWG